jgi:hypothetical protein
MTVLIGDVFALRHVRRDWLIVPTNVGWKSDGTNVMGRGIAWQAAQKYPALPGWYGRQCRKMGDKTPVLAHPGWRLICFPTKPLNKRAPHLSWQSASTVERVKKSIGELLTLIPLLPYGGRILLPAVGCGNGGLPLTTVVPLLLAACRRCDRIALVLRPTDATSVPCPECEGTGRVGHGVLLLCPSCNGSGTLLPTGRETQDAEDQKLYAAGAGEGVEATDEDQ